VPALSGGAAPASPATLTFPPTPLSLRFPSSIAHFQLWRSCSWCVDQRHVCLHTSGTCPPPPPPPPGAFCGFCSLAATHHVVVLPVSLRFEWPACVLPCRLPSSVVGCRRLPPATPHCGLRSPLLCTSLSLCTHALSSTPHPTSCSRRMRIRGHIHARGQVPELPGCSCRAEGVSAGGRGWRTKYQLRPARADCCSALPLHVRGAGSHPPSPSTGTSGESLILSSVVLVVATSRRAVTKSNALLSCSSKNLLVVLGMYC